MPERTSSDPLLLALRAVWPQGVPDEEAQHVARLSKSARLTVLRRLQAVRRFTGEAGSDRVSAIAAAKEAGVSASRLYSLADAWRGSHSILALGGRVNAGRSRAPAVGSAIGRIVERELASDPEVGLAVVMKAIAAECPDVPVAKASIRRILMAARRKLPPKDFGARLVFDSAGLDAMVDEDRLRLYLVLDEGSGVVLGWALATNHSRAWGHYWAAVDALGRLDDAWHGRLPASGESTSVDLRLQTSDVDGGRVLVARLEAHGIAVRSSTGSVGRAVVAALGEKLGYVFLGIGERDDGVSYRNGRTGRMPEYSQRLSDTLEAAIDEHNERRVAAAPSATEGAAARAALGRIREVLSAIENAGPQLQALSGYSDDDIV